MSFEELMKRTSHSTGSGLMQRMLDKNKPTNPEVEPVHPLTVKPKWQDPASKLSELVYGRQKPAEKKPAETTGEPEAV